MKYGPVNFQFIQLKPKSWSRAIVWAAGLVWAASIAGWKLFTSFFGR